MDDKDPPSDVFHPEALLTHGVVFGRRCRGDEEALAAIRPVTADAPATEDAELIRLHSRQEGGLEIEVLRKSTGTKGPAKFATRSYRNNYDSIFGAKQGSTLN